MTEGTTDPLLELVFNRIAEDGLDDAAAEVVLAAIAGTDELEQALAGGDFDIAAPREQAVPARPVHLRSITVTGFRGIGPSCTLTIPVGPGLTLVVGRNGSGKSSFAEAAELALTGISPRWTDKAVVWQSCWQNKHYTYETAIQVELGVDGQSTPVRVRRQWAPDARLDEAEITVTGAASLDVLGLTRPLQLYRPFLSAQDLDKLITGKPSEQYDAMFAILGLQRLADADKRLRDAISPRKARLADVRTRRTNLLTTLSQIEGSSAAEAGKLLSAVAPGLPEDKIAELDWFARTSATHAGTTISATLRTLAHLDLPTPEQITRLTDELRAAQAQVQNLSGDGIAAAARVAEVLSLAIAGHDETGDGPCPICGVGVLDGPWRATADAELTRLRTVVADHSRAQDRARRAQRDLLSAITSIQVPDLPTGIDSDYDDLLGATIDLHSTTAELHTTPAEPDALADHVISRYALVVATAERVRHLAARHFAAQEQAWQSAAADLRVWVGLAREAVRDEPELARLTAGLDWLKKATAALRDTRLAPFAAQSQQIWRALRQDSNVDLGAMVLTGTSTTRKIQHRITVDGVDGGNALGVMSQGELHALGLATFLPRSCAAESPMKFVLIDDPVQSMDPAKVDGLAQVLEQLADDRQVVVFTHDTRLPDAVRDMGIPATVLAVTRAERSVVALRVQSGPVARALDDANAIARTSDIPVGMRYASAATFGRHALEAVCHRVIWHKRLSAGHRREQVAADIEAAKGLRDLLALAFFDTSARGGDVIGQLNAYGRWAGDTYQACKRGAHAGTGSGDPIRLVHNVEDLARRIAHELDPIVGRHLTEELAGRRGGQP